MTPRNNASILSSEMSSQRVICLLGRRDEPTDAVEEYCQHLGQALKDHSYQSEIRRVPWDQHGWAASLDALRLQAEAWRRAWVLVQYTALAWSARGFPNRFLRILRVLRKAGARIAVVFHDAEPFGGTRLIDRFRRAAQVRVMRAAVAWSDHVVYTVPPDRLSWLPDKNGGRTSAAAPLQKSTDSSFIVVGANLPQPLPAQDHSLLHEPSTVAVYSITGGAAGDREVSDIVAAMRFACEKLGKLRLLVFGRYAEVREAALREGLRGLPVDLSVQGLLDGDELVQQFASSDVLLFLRGSISSKRGSAIAGISCGVPVIALEGQETAPPITDAGVVLLPEAMEGGRSAAARQTQIGDALVRVLSDHSLRAGLIRRSQLAHEEFFSWKAIARRYAEFLSED